MVQVDGDGEVVCLMATHQWQGSSTRLVLFHVGLSQVIDVSYFWGPGLALICQTCWLLQGLLNSTLRVLHGWMHNCRNTLLRAILTHPSVCRKHP